MAEKQVPSQDTTSHTANETAGNHEVSTDEIASVHSDAENIDAAKSNIWKWMIYFRRFAYAFLGFYALIFIFNTFSGYRAFAPSLSEYISWIIILFVSLTALAIGFVLVKGIMKFFEDRKKLQNNYVPNIVKALQSTHALLAFTWTGVTSAIGIKFVIFPDMSWYAPEAIIPILAGALAGVTVLGFWSGLTHILDRSYDDDSKKSWRDSRVIDFALFAAIAAPFIFVISTVTSVIGVAGDEALVAHLGKASDQLERDLENVTTFRNREVELQNLFASLSNNLENSYNSACQGTFTGRSGCGDLAKWLLQKSADFSALSTAISNNLERVNATSALNLEALKDLREDVQNRDLNQSVAELQNQFRLRYGQIRATTNIMLQDTTILSAKNQLETLDAFLKSSGGAGLLPKVSEDDELAQDQLKWAENFSNALIAQNDGALKLANAMSARQAPVIGSFEAISVPLAVVVYWRSIVPPWAISLAVDFSLILWALWMWRFGANRLYNAVHPGMELDKEQDKYLFVSDKEISDKNKSTDQIPLSAPSNNEKITTPEAANSPQSASQEMPSAIIQQSKMVPKN